MNHWQIVLVKTAAMFLVICLGWIARRRGQLAGEMTGLLSRLVTDVALPCLVFTQMLRTITAAELRANWFLPVLAMLILLVAFVVGVVTAPILATREQRRTFVFLVMLPNWVFLPLPIAEGLYGDEGVRTILLFSAGTQIMLWTLGVGVLQGRTAVRQSWRNLLTNLGLWATVLGIVVAVTVPGAREWETLNQSGTATVGTLVAGGLVQAMAMAGSLTIPLSLLMIGSQLGGLTVPLHQPDRHVWGVVVVRLLVGPAVTIGLGLLAAKLGWELPEVPRRLAYLVAAMPVGISCSVLAERFGGDTALSAQGVFYTTFFSLLTVPALFYFIQLAGW